MAKQILEEINVADFSWVGVGPQAARELAEHGATVIRVECHRRPDSLRTGLPFKDGVPGIDRGAFGAAYNTNKYGISLDLNTVKGREVARRLVKWADIVTDSMVSGTMAKWGLDYQSCKQLKPNIIYYSTTQQGQYGPYSCFGGYGAFAAVMGGFSHLTGWPDGGPLPLFNNYTDFISPWYIVIALAGALVRRHKTGEGMYIDQAQIEAGLTFLGPAFLDYVVNRRVASRMGNRDPYMAPHGVYPCGGADRWIALAVTTDEEWQTFRRVLGKPDWADDSKFATLLARKENEDELDHLVAEWTSRFTPEQIMNMMQKAGVPAGVVQSCENLFEDPQLKHRQHFRVLYHEVIEDHAYNAPAYHLSKTPAVINRAAPCLGQHNEYVYKEILGYSDDEIADMLIEGVITTEADVPLVLQRQ